MVMAILCLSESLKDSRRAPGEFVIGYNMERGSITAADLKAHGA
jgi:formyltetrahydrofolate synthetase